MGEKMLIKKFKNKWDLLGLYNICSYYLSHQTEQGAIHLLEEIAKFEQEYPVIEFNDDANEVCKECLQFGESCKGYRKSHSIVKTMPCIKKNKDGSCIKKNEDGSIELVDDETELIKKVGMNL